MVAIEGTGTANTRYNIDTFSSPESSLEIQIQWSLYVRAVAVLQSLPVSDPLSYFRIAAIHGLPSLNWPGPYEVSNHKTWCSHQMPRFLTWHRVYNYLWEQAILEQAVILAKKITDVEKKHKYVAEARKLRQPYWDWAHDDQVPRVLKQDTLTLTVIKIIDSDLNTIPNPLHSYTYPEGLVPELWGAKTTRYTDEQVHTNLKGIRRTVYDALNARTKNDGDGFGAFSNTLYVPKTASIEISHNLGHSAMGFTMSKNDSAAFDPIFWFHHASIDRYYSLWQAKFPLKPWQDYGDTVTVDYGLKPFNRDGDIGNWTSRMVQYVDPKHYPSIFKFGVQYPEILEKDSTADQQNKAVEAIQRLYSEHPPTPLDSPAPPPPNGPDRPAMPVKPAPRYPAGCIPWSGWKETKGYPETLPHEAGVRREWQVNVAFDNDLVEEDFAVFFFLGEPGPPSEWGTTNATVGVICTFKATLQTCTSCQDLKGEKMNGTIYLTGDLRRVDLPPRKDFHDLSPVSEYLTKELSWRIRKADGTEYPLLKGDARFSAIAESYLQAYAPVDHDNNPLTDHLIDILGVTYDHKLHPGVTAGDLNYH